MKLSFLTPFQVQTRRDSYPTSLFEVWMLNLMAYLNQTTSEDCKNVTASHPFLFDEPSTYRAHCCFVGTSDTSGVNLATKSATAYPLRESRSSKQISYSLSSVTHFINLLKFPAFGTLYLEESWSNPNNFVS